MNLIKKLMQMWMQLPDIQVFSATTIWDDTDPKPSHTTHTGGTVSNTNDYINGRWSGL